MIKTDVIKTYNEIRKGNNKQLIAIYDQMLPYRVSGRTVNKDEIEFYLNYPGNATIKMIATLLMPFILYELARLSLMVPHGIIAVTLLAVLWVFMTYHTFKDHKKNIQLAYQYIRVDQMLDHCNLNAS